mmetsp:Transcript_14551/g.38726  ORF Transcript_14551/g.38726 Transcript_14551/m.38726 type:complete len:453 (-) Transcript_14551:2457-3815(-)
MAPSGSGRAVGSAPSSGKGLNESGCSADVSRTTGTCSLRKPTPAGARPCASSEPAVRVCGAVGVERPSCSAWRAAMTGAGSALGGLDLAAAPSFLATWPMWAALARISAGESSLPLPASCPPRAPTSRSSASARFTWASPSAACACTISTAFSTSAGETTSTAGSRSRSPSQRSNHALKPCAASVYWSASLATCIDAFASPSASAARPVTSGLSARHATISSSAFSRLSASAPSGAGSRPSAWLEPSASSSLRTSSVSVARGKRVTSVASATVSPNSATLAAKASRSAASLRCRSSSSASRFLRSARAGSHAPMPPICSNSSLARGPYSSSDSRRSTNLERPLVAFTCSASGASRASASASSVMTLASELPRSAHASVGIASRSQPPTRRQPRLSRSNSSAAPRRRAAFSCSLSRRAFCVPSISSQAAESSPSFCRSRARSLLATDGEPAYR